jgi:hypothetical protein
MCVTDDDGIVGGDFDENTYAQWSIKFRIVDLRVYTQSSVDNL